MNQLDLFDTCLTEESVYELLLPFLQDVVTQNNASLSKLVLKEGAQYSSVWIDKQMAFRICCRGNKNYFSLSSHHLKDADSEILNRATKQYSDFPEFHFDNSSDSVLQFKDFLCMVLDKTIDSLPKTFSCCSRVEECGDAKKCIHPNSDLAMECGYRKVMKSGRIFYGNNKNID